MMTPLGVRTGRVPGRPGAWHLHPDGPTRDFAASALPKPYLLRAGEASRDPKAVETAIQIYLSWCHGTEEVKDFASPFLHSSGSKAATWPKILL